MNDLNRCDEEGAATGVYQNGEKTFWVHENGQNTPTALLPREY